MQIASRRERQRVRQIGKYELVSDVGQGGMSAVYRARLVGPGEASKDVALKVISPNLGQDESFLLMFLDEMRVAMSMTHRNIVQTFDAGQQGELYYLVMELVDGCSLRDLLDVSAGSPLPPDIAVFIAMEVCSALGYAHHHEPAKGQPRGVIHRDLSPGNILLSGEGDVKLADFGVAKAAGRRSVTVIDSIKGKLAYMAPEQARGRATQASDLFSLGAVLYEMLSGQPLRRHVSFNAVRDYAGVELPLDRLCLNLSPSLIAIVHFCLAAGPGDRPADARELRRQLQKEHAQLLAGAPEPDAHARLQGYLRDRAVATQRPLQEQLGDTPPADPWRVSAVDRMAQAMFERLRQLPTDPGAAAQLLPHATPGPIVIASAYDPGGSAGARANEKPTLPLAGTSRRRAGSQTAMEATSTSPSELEDSANVGTEGSSLARRSKGPQLVVLSLLALVLTAAITWWVLRPPASVRQVSSRRPSARAPVARTAGPQGGPISVASRHIAAEVIGIKAKQRTVRGARAPVVPRRSSLLRARRRFRRRTMAKLPAAAAAARPGLLYLNSRPWTTVLIDGEYRGETPIEALRLRSGPHKIRLINRKLGVSRSLAVRIEAGKVLRKALVLQ